MISRISIAIRTQRIRNTPIIRRIRGRVIQKQFRPSSPIIRRNPIECLVPVLRARVPVYFAVGDTDGAGDDAVVGIVSDGVDLTRAGESEDFPFVGEVEVVCHVSGRIGQGPVGADVAIWRDLEVVWRGGGCVVRYCDDCC